MNDVEKMISLYQTLESEITFIKSKKVKGLKDGDKENLLPIDINEKHEADKNEKQEADKYVPSSYGIQKILLEKYVLEDRIKVLDDQLKMLVKEKDQHNQQYRTLSENIEEKKKENELRGDSQKLIQLESQCNINQDTNKKPKLEGNDLDCQLVQNRQKTEMDTLIQQVRNEPTETTQVKNQLQEEVFKLEAKKSDLIMTIEKLQKNQEVDDKNATEELQRKIIELQEKEKSSTDQFALLQKENGRLKIEIDRLMAKAIVKKYISFHSVLKQPQSDQAVNGILDLLRGQYSDTDLETVEESKRKKNTPLLVVLYNLSRIAEDVKGALSGIEASSDVALVILHSKEIKKPSEKILTESDFKKLGIIVDINFVTAKGIISNDGTDKAIHQLVGFINKF
ncbi:Hypothetical predicted protein [Mytilus galloprovincialis]|uniref:Uncharacterized protein n=1 Tax=Mytilus galloprovincialis TaxID=29158 RepID=A0A8B6BJU6_MYTGA|nr:Hypothetical predicted protein [Mytilus galloprovincialis]